LFIIGKSKKKTTWKDNKRVVMIKQDMKVRDKKYYELLTVMYTIEVVLVQFETPWTCTGSFG
jgi:hypothetical protein